MLTGAIREDSLRHNAPMAGSVFPALMAAGRSNAEAGLDDLHVQAEKSIPPDILLPDTGQSQKVKCLTDGQRDMPAVPSLGHAFF